MNTKVNFTSIIDTNVSTGNINFTMLRKKQLSSRSSGMTIIEAELGETVAQL
jgi:hypothetical protein